MKKRLFALLLTAVICLCSVIIPSAVDDCCDLLLHEHETDSLIHSENDVAVDMNSIQWQVILDDEREFEARIQKYMPSDEILYGSTEDLLEFILDCEYIKKTGLFMSVPVQPYHVKLSIYPAYQELISRDDFGAVLKAYFATWEEGDHDRTFCEKTLLYQTEVKNIVQRENISIDAVLKTEFCVTANINDLDLLENGLKLTYFIPAEESDSYMKQYTPPDHILYGSTANLLDYVLHCDYLTVRLGFYSFPVCPDEIDLSDYSAYQELISRPDFVVELKRYFANRDETDSKTAFAEQILLSHEEVKKMITEDLFRMPS